MDLCVRTNSRRITPACAGKSIYLSGVELAVWDHPRLRGEKNLQTAGVLIAVGSPPLARGKGFGFWLFKLYAGITPACAGKSDPKADSRDVWRDHPRLRGEKYRDFGALDVSVGSPPLARGKGRKSTFPLFDLGITPACAGKSLWIKRQQRKS